MITPANTAVAKTRLPTRIKINRHEESGLPLAARLGVGVADSAPRGMALINQVQAGARKVKAILRRDRAFTIGKFYCDLMMQSIDSPFQRSDRIANQVLSKV
jgi:hypothetical protein